MTKYFILAYEEWRCDTYDEMEGYILESYFDDKGELGDIDSARIFTQKELDDFYPSGICNVATIAYTLDDGERERIIRLKRERKLKQLLND
jgi:hypothetical protein